MPQSWILMLIGLGLVLGLLASIIAGRLFWLYTERRRWLAARRAAPIAQASLEADHARLQAENAMLLARQERREKELKDRLAEQMAVAARYRNRLDAADAEIGRLRARLQRPAALPAPAPAAGPSRAATPKDDAAAARLRRRIDNLTTLAQKIERQRKSFRRAGAEPDPDLMRAEAEAAELESVLQLKLAELKPARR